MLRKCCCCISLRIGSIILSILGIVGGIVTLIFYHGHWMYIADAGIYLIAYGALLFGALTRNRKAILVNLVLTGIVIVGGMLLGIMALLVTLLFVPESLDNCVKIQDQLENMSLTCDQYQMIKIGTIIFISVIASGLNVYFWICNFSFYHELNTSGRIPTSTNLPLITLNSA